MDRIEQGRRLHERVRAFVDSSQSGAPSETFDELGLAIAAYQAAHVPGYQRLLASVGATIPRAAGVRDLPAVPTDAFRLIRVAAHPPPEDAVVFRTSGTTGSASGEHALSTTATYERAALAWGAWAMFGDGLRDGTAIVLAPPVDAPDVATRGASSLHFMIDLFAQHFCTTAHHLQQTALSPIDAGELRAACTDALARGRPAVVLGTSFAFVHALDALAGLAAPLPPGSRAMHTGGFKGRSRVVEPDLLRAQIAHAFGLEPAAVVGEYGMTELSSQLYETTLRAHLGLPAPSPVHGVFAPPPWMRVVAVDPETLGPLPAGAVGILRFEDLANVDSAIAVQTADRGRCTEAGVELLGRHPGATPRGCSLAVEDLLQSR